MMGVMLGQNAIAGTSVGSGFNYQGELTDNGFRANGVYDFTFKLFGGETGGSPIGSIVFKNGVVVSNGLFNVNNLDFGNAVYDGGELFLQLSVQVNSSPDAAVDLMPRQRVNAVPYSVTSDFAFEAEISSIAAQAHLATNAQIAQIAMTANQADSLAANGASNDQYLQFNGSDWVPVTLVIPTSPWLVNGPDISYSSGKVGIGTNTSNSKVEINSNLNESPLKVSVNGSAKLYMHSSGKLGIGSGNPDAQLTLNSSNQESLSIISNSLQTFKIKENGDIKQSVSSNGMLKYMLELSCNEAAHGGSTISKLYDGLTTGIFVSVSDGDIGETGICKIVFPNSFNILSRYVVASANGRGNSGSGAKGVQCEASNSTTLQCFRYVTNTGLGATNTGEITVLIY